MNNSMDLEFLTATRAEFLRYKDLAEKALAQISDADLHARPEPESNSIAVILQHMAGNLKSRWTNFLTSDGEKPWRERDSEFVEKNLSRAELLKAWGESWACLLDTLDALTPEDLLKTVTIRGQPHTVVLATQRALAHAAYHVGQIVYLAKARKGAAFASLSIPKGQSKGSRAK